MASITLRSVKGSALTFAEGDANFTNLNDDKIEAVVDDTTPQLGGSLDVNGNAIVSASNGNIAIEPNGSGNIALTPTTGNIVLGATTWPSADGTNNQVLKTDGAGTLSWTNLPTAGIASVVEDTSPELGGDLIVGMFAITNTDDSPVGIETSAGIGGSPDTSITLDTAGGQYIRLREDTINQDISINSTNGVRFNGSKVIDTQLEDYKETIHSLGSTDTPTITISNGNVQSVTISAGLALPAFADAAAGQSVTLLVSGSGTASGTGAYKFAGGNKTLTTSSVVSIFYDGTTYWTSIATGFAA